MSQHYDVYATIQQNIGARLVERLDYINLSPKYILDIGCGTGWCTSQLKTRYPTAQIIGFDLAYNMLVESKKKHGWRKKWHIVQGNMLAMPFADSVFDLVFMNQTLHWTSDLSGLLHEINRIMSVNGCLLFSTLGPDTFKELRQAWSAVDQYQHVNTFLDMHDIGDQLLFEYFLDPVLDMECLTATYATLPKLMHSLQKQGVRNINQQRKRGLTTPKQWNILQQAYAALCTDNKQYPLTYEVLYGHAWRGAQRRHADCIETYIPIQAINMI